MNIFFARFIIQDNNLQKMVEFVLGQSVYSFDVFARKWTYLTGSNDTGGNLPFTGQPTYRYNVSCTSTSSGVGYCYGGVDSKKALLSDFWSFMAPSSWSQISVSGTSPGARFGHRLVFDQIRYAIHVLLGGNSLTTTSGKLFFYFFIFVI